MSTADVLTSLAPDFDAPATPRPDFADALWSRIELELRPRLAARPGDSAPRASLRSLLAPFARSPRRLALVGAVALLFVSGVATATYLGVRTWVAASPRGIQVASDFRLSQVVAPSTAMGWYWSTALSADGRDLYFVPGDGNVYRVRGVDGSHPSKPALFLTPRTVPDPAFRRGGAREWQALAPAPGGDLFVLGRSNWGGGKRSRLLVSVVVVHPDGSTQTAVTYRELRDHGILPGTVQTARGPVRLAGEDASFSVVASGADRFWLLARISRHPSGGSPYDLRYFLVEVVDPNGDGDWSDRVAHRVSVPGSVPGFDGRHASAWWYGTPVAEPALPGEGANGSVLLPGSLVGKSSSGSAFSSFRLYRLDDRNGDGDLRDPGEVMLAYRTTRPVSSVASRIDPSSGRPRRQLVLRIGDRISLVSGDRTTTDVGRSFSGWGTVFGGPNGDIFAVQESVVPTGEGDKQVDRVVRLRPGHSRLAAAPEPRQKAIRVPRATGPMLVLTRTSMDARPLSTSWYRADGSRVGVAPRHVTDVCAASHGDLVAFTSDLTVPREPFVYVSSSATGRIRTVSENPATPVCPFDGRHLVLATGSYVGFGNVWTLASHDVRTGRVTRIITGTPRYAPSPDGRRIAYVERTGRGDALVVVDLATLRRHRIAGPFRGRELSGSLAWFSSVNLIWSGDGDRIAFTAYRPYTDEQLAKIDGSRTALPPHRYSVMVADAGGETRTVATVRGGSPSLSWSPDDSRLLVCVPDRDPSTGCASSLAATSAGDVIGTTVRVVSARGPHRNRVVARGDGIVFAGWSPVANVYAWADFSNLHLSDGRTWRTDSDGGNWGGWSPDGRYIAQGPDNGFAVIDVATGKVTHLARRPESEGGTSDLQARWWR